jgi:hypothetical protein
MTQVHLGDSEGFTIEEHCRDCSVKILNKIEHTLSDISRRWKALSVKKQNK